MIALRSMAWDDRLTHLEVVERLPAVVHGQDRLPFRRADVHREARIGLELRHQFRRREIGIGVDVAGEHGGDGGCRIGDEFVGDLVELGGRAPIVGVLDQHDDVALDPVGELEGSGADRMGGVVGGAIGRHDLRVAPAEIVEEIALRVLQRDLDGQRVDRLDRVDVREELLLRVGAVRRRRPIEREFDHVCGRSGVPSWNLTPSCRWKV